MLRELWYNLDTQTGKVSERERDRREKSKEGEINYLEYENTS